MTSEPPPQPPYGSVPPPNVPMQPPRAWGTPPGPPPDNYLVWALLSTALCCLPLGVVSIVYSTQVNSKWMIGDVVGAQQSADKARQFAIWSAVAMAVIVVGYFSVLLFVGSTVLLSVT